jgi:O-antigen/teichoic acid export membrane protein
MLANLLSGVVVARLLGTERAGTVVFTLWIASIGAPVVGAAMWAGIGRSLPELLGRGEKAQAFALSGWLARRLLAYVLFALAGGIALVWIDPAMARRAAGIVAPDKGHQGLTILALLSALTVAQVMAGFANSCLRGEQDFGRLARLSVLSFLLQVIFVPLGAIYYDVSGAVGGYLIGQVPMATVIWKLLPRRGQIEDVVKVTTLRYARFAWAAAVANTFVWSRIEIFFLDRYWGRSEIAFFSVALVLSAFASQGPLLLTGAFLPLFAEKRGRRDYRAMRSAFASGTRMLAMLAIPACLGMAAIAPAMVPMLYGEAFRAAVPATMIIVAVAAASVTTVIGTHLVQALERSDFVFYTAVFGALLSVIGGFLLVPEFGLMGAAISRAAVQMVMVAIGMWFVIVKLGFPFPTRSVLQIFACSACSGFVAWVIVALVDAPASIVAAILAAGLVYLVSLRLLGAVDRDDLEKLSEALGSFPRPLPLLGAPVLRFLGQH